MPFQSKSQARACYAKRARGEAGSWNCEEWADQTDFSELPEHTESKEAMEMRMSELGKQAANVDMKDMKAVAQALVAARRQLGSRAGSVADDVAGAVSAGAKRPPQLPLGAASATERDAFEMALPGSKPSRPPAPDPVSGPLSHAQEAAAAAPAAQAAPAAAAGGNRLGRGLQAAGGALAAGGVAGKVMGSDGAQQPSKPAAGKPPAAAKPAAKPAAPSPTPAISPQAKPAATAKPPAASPPAAPRGSQLQRLGGQVQQMGSQAMSAVGQAGQQGAAMAGQAGSKAMAWIKANPKLAALLGVGVPAAAYGIHRLTRKPQEDKEAADRRGRLLKQAQDVAARNARVILDHYLEKLAAAGSVPQSQALTRMRAAVILGAPLGQAIQLAMPKLAADRRQKLAGVLVKRALDDFVKTACSRTTSRKSYSGKPADAVHWMKQNS